MSTEWLTISEAAHKLGMDRSYIWLLLKRHDVRLRGAYKQGNVWLLPRRELEAFQRRASGRRRPHPSEATQ